METKMIETSCLPPKRAAERRTILWLNRLSRLSIHPGNATIQILSFPTRRETLRANWGTEKWFLFPVFSFFRNIFQVYFKGCNKTLFSFSVRYFLSLVREGALYSLLGVVKCVEKRTLYGYWSSFIPDSPVGGPPPLTLLTVVLKDTSPKVNSMCPIALLTI